MLRNVAKRFLPTLPPLRLALTIAIPSGMLAANPHTRRPTVLSDVCCQNDW